MSGKAKIDSTIEYHLQNLQEELGDYVYAGEIDYYELFKTLQDIDLARALENYLETVWMDKLEKEAPWEEEG